MLFQPSILRTAAPAVAALVPTKPVVKAAKPKAKVAVKSKAKAKAKAQAGARRGTPVEEVHGKAASAMKKSLVDWYNTNRTHSRDYHNTEFILSNVYWGLSETIKDSLVDWDPKLVFEWDLDINSWGLYRVSTNQQYVDVMI